MPFNFNYGGIIKTGKVSGVIDPTDAQDAATKNYVDANEVFITDTETSLGGKVIVESSDIRYTIDNDDSEVRFFVVNGSVTADRLADNAVVTAKIMDSQVTIAKLGSDVTISALPLPTSDLNMNGNTITSLPDPTNETEAANKRYVDEHAGVIDTESSPGFGILITQTADKHVISVDSDVIADTEYVDNAVTDVEDRLDSEILVRAAADSEIRVDFAAADASIRTDFAAADTQLDSELTARIDSEKQARKDSDALIRAEIAAGDSDVTAAFQAADMALGLRIDSEAAVRFARDEALESLIENVDPASAPYEHINNGADTDWNYQLNSGTPSYGEHSGDYEWTRVLSGNSKRYKFYFEAINIDTDVVDSDIYVAGDFLRVIPNINDYGNADPVIYSIATVDSETYNGTASYAIEVNRIPIQGDDLVVGNSEVGHRFRFYLGHSGSVSIATLDSETSGIVSHAAAGQGNNSYYLGGDGAFHRRLELGQGMTLNSDGHTYDIGEGNGIDVTAGQIAVEPQTGGGILVQPAGVRVDTDIIADTEWVTDNFTYTAGYGLTDTSNTFSVDTDIIADTEWVKEHVSNNAAQYTSPNGTLVIDNSAETIDVDTDVIADTDWVKDYIAPLHIDNLLGGNGIQITSSGDTDTIAVELLNNRSGLRFDTEGDNAAMRLGVDTDIIADTDWIHANYDGAFETFDYTAPSGKSNPNIVLTNINGIGTQQDLPAAGDGLTASSNAYTIDLQDEPGLTVDSTGLAVLNDTSLRLVDGTLGVNPGDGIAADTGGTRVRINDNNPGLAFTNSHLHVDPGDGIFIDSTGVRVNPGQGIEVTSSGVSVDSADSTIQVDGNGVAAVAGDGLHVLSGLAVDTDFGISVSSDGVAVDTDVIATRSFVNTHVGGNANLVAGFGLEKLGDTEIAMDTDDFPIVTSDSNEISINTLFGRRIKEFITTGGDPRIVFESFEFLASSIDTAFTPNTLRWDQPLTSFQLDYSNNDNFQSEYVDKVVGFSLDRSDGTNVDLLSNNTTLSAYGDYSVSATFTGAETMDNGVTATWANNGNSGGVTMNYQFGTNLGNTDSGRTATHNWQDVTNTVDATPSGAGTNIRFDAIRTSQTVTVAYQTANDADNLNFTLGLSIDGTDQTRVTDTDTGVTKGTSSGSHTFTGLTIYYDSPCIAKAEVNFVRPITVMDTDTESRTYTDSDEQSVTPGANWPTWFIAETNVAQVWDNANLGSLTNDGYTASTERVDSSDTAWRGQNSYDHTAGADGATVHLVVPSAVSNGFRSAANNSITFTPINGATGTALDDADGVNSELGQPGRRVSTYRVYSFNVQPNADIDIQPF